MNPTGKPVTLTADFKKLSILGIIGLAVFLLLQVLLPVLSSLGQNQQTDVISKQKAVENAAAFAESVLGYQGLTKEIPSPAYVAQSELYGYLSREQLLPDYNRQWIGKYPYEFYRVSLPDPAEDRTLLVDVSLQTGKPAGFMINSGNAMYSSTEALPEGQQRSQLMLMYEAGLSLADKTALAAPLLKQMGYSTENLTVQTREGEAGLIYEDEGSMIGEAVLQIKLTFENGDVRSLESSFTVPPTHTAYVDRQTRLANLLYYIGYMLFSFVLGVLAVVYSSLTRRHTSFTRGIVMSIVYFAISVFILFNMMPYLQTQSVNKDALIFSIGLQTIFNLMMGVILYFSLVGGNGLWKQAGFNPWPRAKEPGYGLYVLRSMLTGYLWAFILLGVQSIIFVILSLLIGSWSTIDETQSPYNMTYAWLLPVMAWMAGIGEEAVYRLFGIPMLKKIVRSTLAASVITSLIWAFGHTLYPIYPVITRPIELLFLGLLFSFIFLRYGFIAVMFSHIVFDCILMGISLIAMGDSINIAAGVIGMLLPAAVGYILYLFNPTKKKKPYITTPHPEGQL
ncbi:CPBP family intramembrane metalloprotease [Paenibacillus sp. P96]|uniref:CPBP family intramembrane metalloprotease n=1 Tax=Paenibacillus zeirhizosphaerae TaxID=2987519 RepID=A0ABT9FUN8_9BACL|nr:type II CAAX endopeptidase family protein [Paenibacillus sp. P96]MDP4098452.1 CPBP family intramembrane metalloprotease [Paenibacillus sp. P96]